MDAKDSISIFAEEIVLYQYAFNILICYLSHRPIGSGKHSNGRNEDAAVENFYIQ